MEIMVYFCNSKVNFAKLEEEDFLKDKQEVFNKNSNLWPQENQQHLPTDTYGVWNTL